MKPRKMVKQLTISELGEADCVYVISDGGITDAEKA
jgi:hypothetical protein